MPSEFQLQKPPPEFQKGVTGIGMDVFWNHLMNNTALKLRLININTSTEVGKIFKCTVM